MSIAKYVMTKGKHWSGLTTRNHLGAIYQSKPQVASKITGVNSKSSQNLINNSSWALGDKAQ